MPAPENEWLSNLKAGDAVLVEGGGASLRTLTPELVTKVTRCIVVVGELRFDRTTGWCRGDKYPRRQILEPTQRRLDAIERKKLTHKITLRRADEFDLATLEELREIARIVQNIDGRRRA